MTLLTRTRRPDVPTFWHNDLDGLFSDFFGNTRSGVTAKTWPAVDVTNKESQIEVRVEIPGCTSDDLNITVDDHILTITGEKKQTQETKDDTLFHRESMYGSFRRDIRLPSDVDADHIDASYEQGVLNLVCPKSDKSKTVKIKVNG